MHSPIRVGLIGDFNEQHKAHQAIPKALAATKGGGVEYVWVPTETVGTGDSLAEFDGIWLVPGMPYRSPDGALAAIRHARVKRKPFLGTSAGFQYAVIEFARNVLGLAEAGHQKDNPKTTLPLISPLELSLVGVKSRVRLTGVGHLAKAYGTRECVEHYHCSYGINPRYRRLLEGTDLFVSAVDDLDSIRAVEIDGHPFFVATLFQPELRIVANPSSPLVDAFVAVCERRAQNVTKVAS